MKKLILIILSINFVLISCHNKTGGQSNLVHLKEPTKGDYWVQRYTYPTNKFNPSWIVKARKTHLKNNTKTPVGKFSKNRSANGTNGLNTSAFTALGPKPLNLSNGSTFSGRVNAIVTHPTDSTVAYIGVDGGGVWKTTNCCNASTTWTNVSDNSSLNGSAIGDLYMDPNNPNIIYAGTGDLRYTSFSFGTSGLFRSTDAGVSWEVLGENVFSPYYNQPVGDFSQYQAIGKVRINPVNSSEIVVGTKTGLYFSLNNGTNWFGPCLTNNFTTQRQDTTGLAVSSSGKIYAAIGTDTLASPIQPGLGQNGANGIYSSNFPTSANCPVWENITTENNGWPPGTSQGDPNPINQLGRIVIAIAPSNQNIIYAQVANGLGYGLLGVWKTVDGGLNWIQVAESDDFLGCDDIGYQSWYNMNLIVSPTNPELLYLSDVDFFRSNNGADNFTNSTCGYAGGPNTGDFVHVDHHASAFVAGDDKRILVGSDGGVYYTNNADAGNPRDIKYTQLNTTLNTIEFFSGDITANFSSGTIKSAIGGAQDNGTSVATWNTTSGNFEAKAWLQVFDGDGMYATIEPINSQRVYVEAQRGDMTVSTSGVLGNYDNFVRPWFVDEYVPFIMAFNLNKHDCGTICEQLMAGTYHIWETITGGLTNSAWYINSPNLTKGNLGSASIINQMQYSISDGSVAIAGTSDGNVQFGFNMGAGTENSASWVNVTGNNAILPNRSILDVVIHAQDTTIAYVAIGGFDQNTPATPGHLYEVTCTTDCSSFTWKNKSGNLPNIPVNSVMVNPNIPSMIFAGTDWGLYYTNDITVNNPIWFRFTQGLPSVMVWDMTIDRGATTLAVFTRSRGAYVWPLATEVQEDLIFKNGFGN